MGLIRYGSHNLSIILQLYREKQVMVDSEIQQLVTLNQELKNVNNDLHRKLEKLSKELGEAEKILQWQKKTLQCERIHVKSAE